MNEHMLGTEFYYLSNVRMVCGCNAVVGGGLREWLKFLVEPTC